ncbi:MAG: hypothetical protein IPO27_09670 [Bacteroidetes bacterium]|nr:hypothetical protein [Bacteroidota bacterium]
MNSKISLTIVMLILMQCALYGQTTILGNNRPAIGPNFLGWNNLGTPGTLEIRNDLANQPINFFTNNLQRMTIRGNDGFIGMNNPTPIFNLTVGSNGPYPPNPGPYPDGGIIALGTSGFGTLLPNGLQDARMIWYPRSSAFRAGDAQAPLWDDVNIGIGSACFGLNTQGMGDASFAAGNTCWANGETAVSLGKINFAFGAQSVTIGCNNTSNDQFGVTVGSFNTSTGIGTHGYGIYADALSPYAKSFGNYVRSNATNAFVIGSGVGLYAGFPGLTNPLTNTINHSLMIGMNSTAPSIFVEGGNGAAVAGQVGINTTTPQNTLEVNSPSNILGSTFSGLRFTDVNNAVNPPTNATQGVLSLDANGNVIWVRDDDNPGSGFINACSTGLTLNYLTKGSNTTEICTTVVHENNNHDIGIGVVNSNGSRLFVLADNGALGNGDNAGGIYVKNFQDPNSTNTNARSLYSGDLDVATSGLAGRGDL